MIQSLSYVEDRDKYGGPGQGWLTLNSWEVSEGEKVNSD